ncbi:MAG: recombinase RecA [Thermoplasmata archaeon]|nr:recombinase RecA [Thermoplasmata archaeon]
MSMASLGIKNIEVFVPGLKEGTVNLLYGPPGSGKSILGMQYLSHGARRGEEVLYISLDQSGVSVAKDFENLDLLLDDIYIFDAFPIISGKAEVKPVREVTPIAYPIKMKEIGKKEKMFEADVLSLQSTLKNVFDRRRYERVVVDSITSLRYFYMRGLNPMAGVHAFLQFLLTYSHSTVLVIAEDFEDLLIEKSIMDSVFYLQKVPNSNKAINLIVEKSSFKCDVENIPLKLTNSGFGVEEKFYLKFVRRKGA